MIKGPRLSIRCYLESIDIVNIRLVRIGNILCTFFNKYYKCKIAVGRSGSANGTVYNSVYSTSRIRWWGWWG